MFLCKYFWHFKNKCLRLVTSCFSVCAWLSTTYPLPETRFMFVQEASRCSGGPCCASRSLALQPWLWPQVARSTLAPLCWVLEAFGPESTLAWADPQASALMVPSGTECPGGLPRILHMFYYPSTPLPGRRQHRLHDWGQTWSRAPWVQPPAPAAFPETALVRVPGVKHSFYRYQEDGKVLSYSHHFDKTHCARLENELDSNY